MSKTNYCTHSTRCICGLCQKDDEEMTHPKATTIEQICVIIDLVSDSSEDESEEEKLPLQELCHKCEDDFATIKDSKCHCFVRAAYCDFCFLTSASNNFCPTCKQAIELQQL